MPTLLSGRRLARPGRVPAAVLTAAALAVTGLLPVSAASAAGAVAIAPERSGDRAVRSGRLVAVSGTAPDGPVTSVTLVGLGAGGAQGVQEVPTSAVTRGDDGALSGSLALGCLFNDPAAGTCDSSPLDGVDDRPAGGVVAVRLEVVAGGTTLQSPALRVDYTRPVVSGYRTVAPRVVEVRFSEPVRGDDNPLDWTVDDPRAVVTGVRVGAADCGYLPASDGRADRDGCTRLLDLAPVTPLPEDATPLVAYVPQANRPLYVDDASNALDRASTTGAASRALDAIRPSAPSVTRVDGEAPSGTVAGREEAPVVEVGGATAGHDLWVERVPEGGQPVRGPETTASGSTASLVAPTLPADGTHVLRVVARDPSGNLSTDPSKTPPRPDGSPNPVTYLLDRVAPLLVGAEVDGGRIRVAFSEPVTGPDDPSHWRVRAPDRAVTAVEGDGATRLLTVAGGAPPGALLDYTPPTTARYADAAANPVADVVGRVVDGLALPTVTAPAGPVVTSASSVPVAGTARPGATVDVFRDADRNGAPDGAPIASAPVGGDGRWSVAAPLQPDARNDLLVQARDGSRTSPTAAVPAVTQDGQPPALSLTSPTGGEVLAGGRSSEVRWTTSDANPAELRVELALDGSRWTPLGTVQPGNGEGALSYTVPDVDTSAARVRVTAVDRAGLSSQQTSAPFTIDAVAPVFSALTTGVREVRVTFSEAVSGPLGRLTDWRVAGQPATVTSADGEGSTADRASGTRVVVLRPSRDLGPDETPDVTYAPALAAVTGQLVDRAGQGVEPGARSVTALDGLRPAVPTITAVDGRAPEGGRTEGRSRTPAVSVSGLQPANVVVVERVPASGPPVRGPEVTAGGSTTDAASPPLPADGDHLLRVLVRDPAGNLSTDTGKAAGRPDGGPDTATYALDTVAPRLLGALEDEDEVFVAFSEPVLGSNDPGHWTVTDAAGRRYPVTEVVGEGRDRVLRAAGVPSGATVGYRPAEGRYADRVGNPVADASVVVGLVGPPTVDRPAAEVLTGERSVEVAGSSVPGSTVAVFRDADGDGRADGPAVAETVLGGATSTYAVTVPLLPDARNLLLVTARRGPSGAPSAATAAPPVVQDATAPQLTVTGLPRGGQRVAAGSGYTVRWRVCDANLGAAPVRVELSVDGARTWSTLRAVRPGADACATATTAQVALPDTRTDTAQLRVQAVDRVDRLATVTSRAFRLVDPAGPVDPVDPDAPSEPEPTVGLRDVRRFACPPDQVQDAGFTDVDGNQFELEIECLAEYAFTKGVTADRYVPQGTVTRRQMALFVHRVGEHGGVAFDSRDAGFTDLGGLDAEARDAVNGLANAGVVRGRSATSYAPDGLVSRDQMASFLSRLQGVVGEDYVAETDAFADDEGNVHEESIDRLAAAGVVQGVAEGSYNPFGTVSRQQMSAFLMRYVDDRIEAGEMAGRYAG